MEKDVEFVHLHVHTGYSLLDGSGKIKDLIGRAKELNMKALAITDHGAMYGCVEFYKECINQGIKPIIGCEIYVSSKGMMVKDNSNEIFHLVLLVKNQEGYNNLIKIVSKASIDGFYYKPRVDKEFLRNHSKGLIATSACLGGEVQSLINRGDIERGKEAALIYKEIFKDGFYLELQNHGIEDQQKVNKQVIKISKETRIPLIATNDVHYIKKEDWKAHDVLLCIQTAKTVEDEDRMRYPSGEFYLKSGEEIFNQFSYIEEAISNTVKIGNECNFQYTFHESHLPKFPVLEGVDPYIYLRDLCYKGLSKKYKDIDEELITRLEYELTIIKEMGYIDYFLIVWDFIKYADDNGIMTGPGRGSAAGSIVAYTLNITKIDPIKYNLIFERFLNPERISMPDIDSDFCYERRQEVIDYVVSKYGSSNVSQIITFGTMAPRACIRDVGRAMNYSYAEVDKIAKMIPTLLNITIERALEINEELNNLYEEDERVKELIDIAKNLEGLPRHTSTHAAGVVIASEPLVNFVPLLRNEGAIVTQFTMNTLEELGLLKMDFLGLRTLTVMRDTIKMVKENRNIDILLDQIDIDDKEVYKMVGEGKTAGVFQLESQGMTSFMKELKPDSLEDIIAGISLYRPGPMAEIPRYIENKKNSLKINYLTPMLENILDVTYGCMVYQEQVMEIVRELGGYSYGRSDLVRRAMSKKKYKVMEEERKNFIFGIVENGEVIVKGCIRNGISEEIGNKLFDQMMDFASYAFNKSHAAAYAVIAYETAYLIRYFPQEYIASMLNSFMGSPEKVSYYLNFAKDNGIECLPPSINDSKGKFTVKENTIRFGLTAIKNVGAGVIDAIVEIREKQGKFKDLSNFIENIDSSLINKRAIESLIFAGALDSFGKRRSQMIAVYDKIIDGVGRDKKRNIKGQVSLFSSFEDEHKEIAINYPEVKEFDKRYLLSMEKEMTGLYITGHPLAEYDDKLRKSTDTKTIDIIDLKSEEEENFIENKVKDEQKVKIGGIISSLSKKVTRKNDMMAFVTLEDLYGSIEVIIFPKILERCKDIIKEDGLVIVTGRVNIREDELPKIIAEGVEELKNEEKTIEGKEIYILIDNKEDLMKTKEFIRQQAKKYKGNIPVILCTNKEKQKFILKEEFCLNPNKDLIEALSREFGHVNVKIM